MTTGRSAAAQQLGRAVDASPSAAGTVSGSGSEAGPSASASAS